MYKISHLQAKKRVKKRIRISLALVFSMLFLCDYVFLLDTSNLNFYLVQLFIQFMRFMIHFDDNNGNVVQFSFEFLSTFKVCSDSIRFERKVLTLTLFCMNLELVVHFVSLGSNLWEN